jgi:group I intron endonuclease
MWLYKLTNTTNDRAYIGTSVHPISHRISRHVYAAKRGRKDMAIASAIRKYGIDNFRIEEIGQSDDYEELLSMESKAILEHNTICPNGYNITPGGKGARRICSQETRARISARTKGRIPWNFGKRNEQTVRRYANRGNIGHPPIGSKPWNFGKKLGPMPEEQRQHIADTMRQVRATRFWHTRPFWSTKPDKLIQGGI